MIKKIFILCSYTVTLRIPNTDISNTTGISRYVCGPGNFYHIRDNKKTPVYRTRKSRITRLSRSKFTTLYLFCICTIQISNSILLLLFVLQLLSDYASLQNAKSLRKIYFNVNNASITLLLHIFISMSTFPFLCLSKRNVLSLKYFRRPTYLGTGVNGIKSDNLQIGINLFQK